MKRILLVEDKESLARMLQEAFESEGFEVEWYATGADGIRALGTTGRYAVVLTDLRLPGADGLEVLRQVREQDPDCPVILMTGFGTVDKAVEAMKLGAYDFIQKPIDLDHLTLLLRRCLEYRMLRTENLLLREEFQRRHGLPAIIGESEGMRRVSEQIQKVAPTDSTILLLGESGTGKELFARAIHQLSGRANRPFVAVNCAAIPETLIENELFGHEKGSYTGATSRQIGKFELADLGTLFLDEIGELSLAVQSKILRVLEERSFERIGGRVSIDVDVRILCATNKDLAREVKEKRFREDLFFRIHVIPIEIPPLRNRRADIDALTTFFVEKYSRELGKPAARVTEEARAVLRDAEWPGNVRELQNCIERAVILCDRNVIDAKDLLVGNRVPQTDGLRDLLDFSGTLREVTARASERIERMKIADALERTGDRASAARDLGISLRTLQNKMRELGLGEPPS